MTENRHPQQRHAPGPVVRAASRRLGSRELMQGTREVIIEHSGTEYRLRVTSKGKLILTK